MLYLVDLDGTISDDTKRAHWIAEKRDFQSYYGEMANDDPIWPTLKLIQQLPADRLVFWTGRPEEFRGVTQAWLAFYGVGYRELVMRGPDDKRPNGDVKAEWLDGFLETTPPGQILIIDDNPAVFAMALPRGVVTLQVRQPEVGEFVDMAHP